METKVLTRLNETVPSVFDDFFKPWTDLFDNGGWNIRPMNVPAVNITEQPNEYLLSLAAPGMKKEDFKIDVDGNMLTISSEKEEKKEDLVDEQTLQLRKVLKTPLEDLDLSVRAFNCLKAAKINSLSELVQYEQEDLMKFRNFGQKSLSEIEQVLNERGLGFGMDLSKLKLDDE